MAHDGKNSGARSDEVVSHNGRRELIKGIAFASLAGVPALATGSPPAGASVRRSPHIRASQLEQWGLQEITLESHHEYSNPFRDVWLHCTFTSGKNAKTVEGFFDGGSTWRVRFMPESKGRWTFKTVSNDSALDGTEGKFDVVVPADGNHGPVRVAKTYHFSHADGTPLYVLGTTFYMLFQQSRDAILRSLSSLSGTSFNKVRIFVMPPSSAGNVIAPFPETAEAQFDLDRYNVEFFRGYESGLSDLQALGIEADLILFNPYDFKGMFSRLSQARDEHFIRYTAARLSAYRNVWWTLANEFDLYSEIGIHKDWLQLGEILKAADPYSHLRGIHNSSFGFYDNSQSWITHVILQDIVLQRLTAVPRDDSLIGLNARRIGKPVMIDEYGYEGNIATTWGSLAPREVVQMHWSIVMAGAYGSHGETYFGTPKGALVGEAPQRLAFLRKIMSEMQFQSLEPLPDALLEPNASITVLGDRGKSYLFYFARQKQRASWNPGFFGPATPAHPLPIPDRHPTATELAAHENPPAPKFLIDEGVYRVELIDTWQMKVHQIGFTSGASQQFHSLIEPGCVRLTRVESAPPQEEVRPVAELLLHYSPAI